MNTFNQSVRIIILSFLLVFPNMLYAHFIAVPGFSVQRTNSSFLKKTVEELLNYNFTGMKQKDIFKWYDLLMHALEQNYQFEHIDILRIVTRQLIEALRRKEITQNMMNNCFFEISDLKILVPQFQPFPINMQNDYNQLPLLPDFDFFLLDIVQSLTHLNKQLTIGISGAPGSGKTVEATVLTTMCNQAGLKTFLLPMDAYLKPRSMRRAQHLRGMNTYDLALLHRHIQYIKQGKSFRIPKFIPKTGEIIEGDLFDPKKYAVIIFEGHILFAFEELTSILNLKVFIDEYDPLRLAQRFRRDPKSRNYTIEEVAWSFIEVQFTESGPITRKSIQRADIIARDLKYNILVQKKFPISKTLQDKYGITQQPLLKSL